MFNVLPIEQHCYQHNFAHFNDWKLEYIELDEGVGYWIGDHPFSTYEDFDIFKEIISCYPINRLNNNNSEYTPNPFSTISTPPWVWEPFCQHLETFYTNFTDNFYPYKWREWGNVYMRGRCMPVDRWRIPHIDSSGGLVCNLWLDIDENPTGTNLYRYRGNIINEKYDFMVDENHKLHKEWLNLSDCRRNPWRNFSKEEADYWNFELLTSVPAKTGKVTMYNTNIPHAPYVSKNTVMRWSHAFCIDY